MSTRSQNPWTPSSSKSLGFSDADSSDKNLLSDLWTRPNPALTDLGDILNYALTFNAYAYAERYLNGDAMGDVFAVAEKVERRFRKKGRYEGSFVDLRLTLFALQRQIRNDSGFEGWGDEDDDREERHARALNAAICAAWEREVNR